MYNKSEIAQKTGLSRATVSNILNKKQANPKIESLIKIANVLDCSVEDLIKKEPKENSN